MALGYWVKIRNKVICLYHFQYTYFGKIAYLYHYQCFHKIDIVDENARFEFIDGSLSLVMELIKHEESRQRYLLFLYFMGILRFFLKKLEFIRGDNCSKTYIGGKL